METLFAYFYYLAVLRHEHCLWILDSFPADIKPALFNKAPRRGPAWRTAGSKYEIKRRDRLFFYFQFRRIIHDAFF